MPHYVASGSHFYKGEKYRFLIIPRYERDLEKVLKEKNMLNLKTVLTISLQMFDVLEYIHDKGYIHSDIKASNIMLENGSKPIANSLEVNRNSISSRGRIEKPCLRKLSLRTHVKRLRSLSRRILRPMETVKYIDDIPYLEDILKVHEGKMSSRNKITSENDSNHKVSDHAYLLDFGLASKYHLANGTHKPFCTDERKAHAGTVLFCSRDAHKGVPTRRSDLESLGYNIIYWLTGELPWMEDLTKPEEIENKKNRCFRQLQSFLQFCFYNEYPTFLLEYFNYLSDLQFEVSQKQTIIHIFF